MVERRVTLRAQIRALCWVKLILMRNTWNRGKALALVARTAMLALAVLVAGVVTLGMVAFGYSVLAGKDPFVILIIFDGIVLAYLVFWVMGMLSQLERADLLDFRTLLFLPMSLPAAYLLNFAASLLSPLTLVFFLPMLGLALGWAVASGPGALWVLPLATAFYFVLAAWAYYLRGLLAVVLENKRRRRAILVVLPMMFVLLAQAPNLITWAFFHRSPPADGAVPPELPVPEPPQERSRVSLDEERLATAAVAINAAVPLGWFPLGAYGIPLGSPLLSLLSTAGLVAAGGAGLALGYRSTLRYYTGKVRSRRRRIAARSAQPAAPITARRVPGAASDTAAMAWASYLSYTRHPRFRIAIIMPVVVSCLFVFVMIPDAAKSAETAQVLLPLLTLFLILFPLLTMAAFMFNLFGIDVQGFRALILLPTPRHKYLLGRNLALLPPSAGMSLVLLLAVVWLGRLGPSWLIAGMLHIAQAYILFCTAGNLFSIYFPSRLRMDAMKSGGSGNLVGALLMMFVGPVMMLPAAVAILVDVGLDFFLGIDSATLRIAMPAVSLALSLVIYRTALVPTGNLLMQKEQDILRMLVKDRE